MLLSIQPYKLASLVPCDTYKSILYFNFILFRALKSSLKELIHLHSWEQMSAYWKSDILTDILPIKKGQPRIVCGVMLDPVQFLPLYLDRFLTRREMEGNPLSPGHYSVEFKVYSQSELSPLAKAKCNKTFFNLFWSQNCSLEVKMLPKTPILTYLIRLENDLLHIVFRGLHDEDHVDVLLDVQHVNIEGTHTDMGVYGTVFTSGFQ